MKTTEKTLARISKIASASTKTVALLLLGVLILAGVNRDAPLEGISFLFHGIISLLVMLTIISLYKIVVYIITRKGKFFPEMIVRLIIICTLLGFSWQISEIIELFTVKYFIIWTIVIIGTLAAFRYRYKLKEKRGELEYDSPDEEVIRLHCQNPNCPLGKISKKSIVHMFDDKVYHDIEECSDYSARVSSPEKRGGLMSYRDALKKVEENPGKHGYKKIKKK